jgi:phosphoribosylpyrophosphate synthetase
MKIIPGPASTDLGKKVSEITGFELIPVSNRVFPDGESYVRIEGNVHGEHVVILVHLRTQD